MRVVFLIAVIVLVVADAIPVFAGPLDDPNFRYCQSLRRVWAGGRCGDNTPRMPCPKGTCGDWGGPSARYRERCSASNCRPH